MSLRFLFPAALLCTAALGAQSFVVSPSAFATQQGNASNPIPFNSANARYQQIHGDLRGTPRVLLGMAVRRGSTAGAAAVARSLDLTVVMANSNIKAVSGDFAGNYVGAPTTVAPRNLVNFPDWTTSAGSPEPWSIVVPFTTPFVYIGTDDLLWEWVVENNTGASQSYPADVYSGLALDINNAARAALGTACTVSGQTRPLSYGPRAYTSVILDAFYFAGTALNAAPGAPSLIMVGASDPDLAVPGLCANLRANPILLFPSVSSATGSFQTPHLLAPWDPAFVGARLYSQAVTTDNGQPGIPLALSEGVETTIPTMHPPGAEPIVRIFDTTSATSTSGMVNYYAYGMTVRFTH